MNTRESFGNRSSNDKSVVLDWTERNWNQGYQFPIDLRVCSSSQEIRNRGLLTKKDSLVVQGEQCFCALCSLVCRMKPFEFYDIIYIFLMHAQTFTEKCNVWTN